MLQLAVLKSVFQTPYRELHTHTAHTNAHIYTHIQVSHSLQKDTKSIYSFLSSQARRTVNRVFFLNFFFF